MKKLMNLLDNKKVLCITAILIIALCSIEIFIPTIYTGHDLHFHIARIKGIADSWSSGNLALIYPGYLNGYGYANGVFYPDLFLYIPAILYLCGLSLAKSFQVLLVLINIGSFASMYFCVSKITHSKKSACLLGILYTASSYRMVDTIIRAALGETLTFVFFPLLFLGLYELLYENEKEWYWYTLGLAGIIYSHLISALFALFLSIFLFIAKIKKMIKEPNRIKYILLAGITGILLGLAFIGPMLECLLSDTYLLNIGTSPYEITEYASNPLYIFNVIPNGLLPWQSPGIGWIFIILLVIYRKEIIKEKGLSLVSAIGMFFFLWMSTSLFPWELVKSFLGTIQFPWRLYGLATILGVLALAKPIASASKEKQRLTYILIVMASLLNIVVLEYYHYRQDPIKGLTEYAIVWGEYLPTSIDQDALKERGKQITTEESSLVVSYQENGIAMTIEYQNHESSSYIDLPRIYYKGYVATLNGKNLEVTKSEEGYVRVILPSDTSGTIEVNYGITSIRVVCNIITILTVTGLTIYLVKKKKHS